MRVIVLRKIRLLIWGTGTDCAEWYRELLGELRKSYEIEYLCCVDLTNETIEDAEMINFFDVSMGVNMHLENYPVYQCGVVDTKLLEELSPYLYETLKMMDRWNIYDYESRWRYYVNLVGFWNKYLDKNQINLFVHHDIPHEVSDYILYTLCRVRNISYVGNWHAMFRGTCWLHNDVYAPFKALQEAYDNQKDVNLTSKEEEVYKKYVSNGCSEHPYYMKEALKKLKEYSGIKTKLKAIKERWRMLFRIMYHAHEFAVSDWRFVREVIMDFSDFYREYVTLYNYYEENCTVPNFQEKYFYVPINYQPEATSSPCGGGYVDLILYIKMLDACLPEGYYLYVKEHPATLEYSHVYHSSRSDIFYDELLGLKHVKLMSLKTSTFSLMENAIALATLTSTAGMEGIFKRKPCLCFGNAFYQVAPGCIKINTMEECQAAVNQVVNGEIVIEDDDLKRFIKAVFKTRVEAVCQREIMAENAKWEDNLIALGKAYASNIKSLF